MSTEHTPLSTPEEVAAYQAEVAAIREARLDGLDANTRRQMRRLGEVLRGIDDGTLYADAADDMRMAQQMGALLSAAGFIAEAFGVYERDGDAR